MTRRPASSVNDAFGRPIALLVCAPYRSDTDPAGVVRGSVVVMGLCGHRVWVAPSGQRRLAEGASPECLRCWAANNDGSTPDLTPDGAQELRDVGMSPEEIRTIHRMFGAYGEQGHR